MATLVVQGSLPRAVSPGQLGLISSCVCLTKYLPRATSAHSQGQHAFLVLQHLGFALYPSPNLGQQTYTLSPPALVFIYDVKTGIVP